MSVNLPGRSRHICNSQEPLTPWQRHSFCIICLTICIEERVRVDEDSIVHHVYLAAEFFVDLVDLKEKFLLEIIRHVQTIGDQRGQLEGDVRIGLT